MNLPRESIYFKSSQFTISPSEESETNPGRFGREVVVWLRDEFSKLGYDAEVIPEDWGWCVMCKRGEFLLWVGCGSMQTEDMVNGSSDSPPNNEEVIWNVFPEIEIPIFKIKSLFRKWLGQLDLETPLNQLRQELLTILESNDSIELVDEP